MRAIRSINNNIAVCVDSAGNELIAMGKGIGYGKMPHEVDLANISHTYYSVDARQLAAVRDIPADVLDFAASENDRVRAQLSYQLSPNYVFTLADHIAFAIQRAKQNLQVRMPLAYDVEQSFPTEWRIGRQMVRRIRRAFRVALRDDEAAGIALGIVNARASEATADEVEKTARDEDMLEDVTEIVEDHFHVAVDRSSFAFSRYATHLGYLFARLRDGEPIKVEGVAGYRGVQEQFPEAVACVEKVAAHLERAWDAALTDEEKLFLVLHVSRLCARGAER